MRYIRYILILIFSSCLFSLDSFAQLGFSLNIDKPKTYEDRVLRAEQTGEKKFTIPRRFFQNTTTHYNYFFNANTKLNEVLENAKAQHRDDFSKLLSFYNYTLDATAANTIQLDSIILKSQSGIVLHDLRNDWIDNLYLLWGAAYYLKKDFDSASQLFHFINYAFADKEKDGYYKFIGSNMDGNSATRITTKEDRNLKDRIFSEPPSRNDAFIWQIRTHIAREDYTAASVLIEALKMDPAFPERLQNDLNEVQALWFYKQAMWDSAATYLVRALDNAQNKQEKARWEFLAAQLFELSGSLAEASTYYDKAINHTTDPVMEIYARLNAIKTNRDSSGNSIDHNISELLKMARRDKYQDYRNIIYFMAAQMELERQNSEAAYALLLKGSTYNTGDPSLQNKIFLQLAEMAFTKKAYRQAFNFYDSLRTNDPALKDMDKIQARKKLLGELAGHWEVLGRQDSLQKVAAMPVEDRDEYIKKLVRQMRKAQGLKDNADFNTGGTASLNPRNDIFSPDEKGEWYFYNNSLRTRGAVEFKSRWGNRPNVDHWRRVSAAGNTNASFDPKTGSITSGTNNKILNTSQEISYDALLENLPLTADKMAASNDSIQNALFALGNLYLNGLEDCAGMNDVYTTLQQRFPGFNKMDQVLFNQYYCQQKNGNTVAANQLKQQLSARYPASKFTTIATTGADPANKVADPVATAVYEKIYDQFIEGNFTQALAGKLKADSLYGETYWTPQQLYIESVYYIQQRNDSTAINILNKITSKFPKTPLAEKAITMIDVLKRRDQIEAELRNLQIERPADDTFSVVEVFKVTRPQVQDTVVTKPVAVNTDANKIVKQTVLDTVAAKPVIKATTGYNFNAQQPHMVMLVLNKVDPVFINEARTAMFRYNREKFYNQQLNTEIVPIDADHKLIIIGPFADAKTATDYVDRAKPITSTQIMPWLKAEKYRYSIISNPNLEVLKTDLDVAKYREFLEQHLPGLF